MSSIIGKLKEKLVIESNNILTVIPAGVIVEISSEEDYPHTISKKQMYDAVKYLKKVK